MVRPLECARGKLLLTTSGSTLRQDFDKLNLKLRAGPSTTLPSTTLGTSRARLGTGRARLTTSFGCRIAEEQGAKGKELREEGSKENWKGE